MTKLLIIFTLLFWFVAPAEAHSWYSRTGCCNGNDCAPVPVKSTWISIVAEGYLVRLSLEEAKLVNPTSQTGVNVVVPWGDKRIKPPVALLPGEHYHLGLYDLCISNAGHVRCLFITPNT